MCTLPPPAPHVNPPPFAPPWPPAPPGTTPNRTTHGFRILAGITQVLGAVYLVWRALRTLRPGYYYYYSIPFWWVQRRPARQVPRRGCVEAAAAGPAGPCPPASQWPTTCMPPVAPALQAGRILRLRAELLFCDECALAGLAMNWRPCGFATCCPAVAPPDRCPAHQPTN